MPRRVPVICILLKDFAHFAIQEKLPLRDHYSRYATKYLATLSTMLQGMERRLPFLLVLNYIFLSFYFQLTELRKYDVPDYVINHGIVNISTLMNLFQSSKVNEL